MTTIIYSNDSTPDPGNVAFYVLLWKRKEIDLQTFNDYWRDVHGPVCARLPGQFQYKQFHVLHNPGDPWSALNGITSNTTPEDQIDGIAELLFESEQDRQTWFQAAAILMNDEHNIFSKAIGYNTSPGNSKTYVDRTQINPSSNRVSTPTFHVLVRKVDTVSTEAFRHYMANILAPGLSQNHGVIKFRLHLFEAVDNSRPDAMGVSHVETPEKQYQAAFEIAFANLPELERLLESLDFFASEPYAMALRDLPQFVKEITPFPQHTVYTFVQDGKLTLAGQRGASIAELIARIGATNQLQEEVVSLMYTSGAVA